MTLTKATIAQMQMLVLGNCHIYVESSEICRWPRRTSDSLYFPHSYPRTIANATIAKMIIAKQTIAL
jgi:hypothetical protein